MRAAALQISRRHRALAGLQHRAFAAAAEAALAEQPVETLPSRPDLFLRFASPKPLPYAHKQVLGYVPDAEVSTLSNGLRVATETTPFAETATVAVWIDAGSRYEAANNNGTAHFLEHMAFKGTKSRSVSQLEVEIENLGAHLNAYTSREQTCYYARVAKKDVPKAMDILSDILQNSVMDENAVNRERDVILREMQEVEKVAEEVVFDHLHATAFQYSPLGRTILGPADNIRSITRADLVDYVNTHYTAPRMVVSAAGAVQQQQVADLAEKAFGGLPSSGPTAMDLVKKEPAIFTGSDVRFRDPDLPLLHLALAFQGASWTDPDSVALMVMQTLLGAWDKNASAGRNLGSQLAQTIATNNLCNSYMAFNTNYHDTGLFGVYAVADKAGNVDDMCYAIMSEITKLSYSVPDDDVVRARNQLKASLLFSQDVSSGRAEDIGRQLLVYGRRVPRAELFARIDAVTPEVVKAVANRFLYDQDLALCAMGAVENVPDYNWFRRRTFWLRY